MILDAAPPPPDRYLARGRVRLAAGWQAVAGIDPSAHRGDDANDDRESTALLPPLVEGQRLEGTYGARAKQTTPPPRYTEATLLGAMESAGKTIDDETLRAAMKDSGLGTPATRASIIETLLKRDYIVRDRQHLVPTETGTGLIEALPVASLASPELTGSWEARLARIARGEDSRTAFMADIARYVSELVDAIRISTPAPPPANQPESAFAGGGRNARRGGPRGSKPRREKARPRARHDRPAPQIAAPPPGRDDRAIRVPPPISVARAVATQPMNSRIDLHQDASIVAALRATSRGDAPSIRPAITRVASPPLVAPRPARSKPAKSPPTALTCPRCESGTLLTGSRGWGCSRWREGCRFVVWFEHAGKRLTKIQLRDLIKRGQTRESELTIDGVKRAGRFVLDARAAIAVTFKRR